MRRARVLKIAAVVVGVGLIVGTITVVLLLRDGVVKRRIVNSMSDRLKSHVTIGPMSVRLFPRVLVLGEGLTIRRFKDPPDYPPLISAVRFSVQPGLWYLLTGRAKFVEVEGLRVTLPRKAPKRPSLAGTKKEALDEELERKEAFGEVAPTETPEPVRDDKDVRVLLERLVASDAELVYISSQPDRLTRIIPFKELELSDVSYDKAMNFRAVIDNPMPKGPLEAKGLFGPWNADDPGDSPVEGAYVIENGDISSLKGLTGAMRSRGLFSGEWDELRVDGTTESDNFQLDSGSRAVKMQTAFVAVADGTDGDFYFTHIDGRLQDSPFTASGAITRVSGIEGHRVELDVEVPAGRVEDFLTLCLPSERPMMAGDVTLKTSFLLTPGEGSALNRMELDGTIGVSEASFSGRAAQAKIRELSRRAQGKKKDAPEIDVVMGLNGKFTYKAGVARFKDLKFRTTGAEISVGGTFGVPAGNLNMSGTARFDTSASRFVGGVKGFFLKILDPLFRRDGAGAVIPINIKGTHAAPAVSVDKSRALKRK